MPKPCFVMADFYWRAVAGGVAPSCGLRMLIWLARGLPPALEIAGCVFEEKCADLRSAAACFEYLKNLGFGDTAVDAHLKRVQRGEVPSVGLGRPQCRCRK